MAPPDEFMAAVRAWQESRVILSALELDLFTAVGDGASAEEVARRLKTDRRATGFLLHALVAIGLLEKHGDAFRNGPVAARHLAAGSPADQRAALMHTAALWHRWSHLTECVRSGAPAPRGPRDAADTEAFIAAMEMNASLRAPQIAAALELTGVRRMLDVGGGSGAYALACARSAPELRAEILDLADVLPITDRHIARAGLADRVATHPGDLNRDDLGSGYDLVLMSAICHMNTPEQNADLIRRAARALAPGGRAVVHDYILEPDRTTPRLGALFALNMLVNTPGGGNYTEAEYFGWMEAAGLTGLRHLRLKGPTGLVIGTKKG